MHMVLADVTSQWENVPGGVPTRIKHPSAVKYGEIFHSPHLTLTRVLIKSYIHWSINS